MNLIELTEGIKNNTINIINNGHKLYQGVIEKLEHYIKIYKDFDWIYETILIGHPIRVVEYNCYNCGSVLYFVLLDFHNVTLIESDKYWKLQDNYGKLNGNNNKYNFKLTSDILSSCIALDIINNKKLTSTINIKTGNLIFDNYFENEELNSFSKDINIYSTNRKYDINNIIGRNSLMQYLSTKNVGYGQMSNTSVSIWSNKTEVLVTDCYLDEESVMLENLKYDLENSKNDKEKKEIENKIKSVTDQIEFIKTNFKYKGDISLSVWRWQCADKSILDSHNEKINKKAIKTKVNPGKYLIEHYYDFMRRGDSSLIYSKLKLIT